MRSLRAKLAWSHIIPTILLLPILSLYLLFTLEDFYIQGLLRQLVFQAELLREDIQYEAQPITSAGSAQRFLETIRTSTDSNVMLLDRNAVVLASNRPEDAARVGTVYDHPSFAQALRGETVRGVGPGLSSEVAYVALPWQQDGAIGGVLRLSYRVDDVRAQFDQFQWLIISGSILTVFAALTVALALATTITRPLRQLTERAREIAAGDYTSRVETHSRDEVGTLALSFNQMAARLEEAEQARGRQLAAIIHELARPIAGMRAAVETLRDGADQEPEMRDALFAGTEEELARLDRLIGTLQGLHKRAIQPMQLNCTEISIDRLIRASVATFEPVATRMGISLSVEMAPDLPSIHADEDRLIQVLTNLLDNALKFTPQGGKIVVGACQDIAYIRITVADTGVGIARDELPNIFQQFYRGHESRPPENRGMGLGLAICREIITAHGGTIMVESESGKGSRFTFHLPKECQAHSPPS